MRRIKDWFSNIKYTFQRATRGYSDVDLWNVNTYIAKVIADVMQEWLKRGISSYKGSMTEEEWDDVLVKIQNGFSEYRNHAYSDVELDVAKVDEALALLKEHFYDLWDQVSYESRERFSNKANDFHNTVILNLWSNSFYSDYTQLPRAYAKTKKHRRSSK